MFNGSDDLICSLEHNAPMVGYNNLQATGEQPMSTGSATVRRPGSLAVAGERRIDAGRRAGVQVRRCAPVSQRVAVSRQAAGGAGIRPYWAGNAGARGG